MIKMLLVKRFLGEAYKLRGFLTQIKIKITNKGLGLLTVIKQVAKDKLKSIRQTILAIVYLTEF